MKLLTFVISIIYLFLTPSAMSQNYEVESITVKPYSETIRRVGRLAFDKVVNLSFKSGGYLTKLTVDEGEVFSAEQLLASLDISELVEDKNAQYALLLQAKRDVNRQKEMLSKKLGSERDLDLAMTQLETQRARYKVAYYNLNKAQIVSPFLGVVLAVGTELGELQAPGRNVLTVAPLKDNWVIKVSLTGEEVSRIRLNEKVAVKLSGFDKITGHISKIPAIANVRGHLFEVEIALPYQEGFIAGQLAEVEIDFSSEDYVYQLPIKALVSVGDAGQAWVVTQNAVNNKLAKRAFDVRQFDNDYIYLRANADDTALNVVTKGWQNITLAEK